MTLSMLQRRIRAAEAASETVAIVALLPLVPLWLEAVRTLRSGDGTPTREAEAAYRSVRAALASIKTDQHNLSEGEAAVVHSCVRALRTLPLAELRRLAGSRLPGIDEEEMVNEKGSTR